MKFVFAEYVLDVDRRELRRGGKPVALEPQVFDLLVYLVHNRDRVVSKDDLLEAIWGGRIVSESALTSRITAVRKAIGDNGAEQRLIRTVSRKGLRFIGSVREEEELLRKLAAIFVADVEGYSRLMGQDEVGTLRRLTACRAVLDQRIAAFRGRVFGSAGDSVIADFASAVDAVQCALAVQEALAAEERIRFRIGVHVGDVIVQGDNLFGDGVNIAERLETLAAPGGICISGAVRDQVANKLPLVSTDLGEQQVKNIVQPIRAYRVGSAADAAPVAPATGPVRPVATTREASDSGTTTAPRLSIVVLPFANLSNDPEQDYLADGITEDLTTDLSRISGSFVIARNTAFTFKGMAVDVKRIASALGVRYVLEGSVQRAGDDIRVNVQLVDAEGGAHLWADRFDTDRRNLVDAQREITGRVARSLSLELVKDLGRRIEQERAVDPDARDLVMQGYAVWYRPRSVRNNEEAERIFRRALAIDPRSIDAKIGIAKIVVSNVTQAWSHSAEEDTEQAERLLLDVLEDNTGSALAHSTMGMVRRFQNRLTESRFEFETAISLDPNDTYAHVQLGWVMLYLGDPGAAVSRCEKAIRLSPRDPQLWGYHLPLGWCHLLCGDADAAVDQLIRSRSLNPRLWHIHFRACSRASARRGRRASAGSPRRDAGAEPEGRLAGAMSDPPALGQSAVLDAV